MKLVEETKIRIDCYLPRFLTRNPTLPEPHFWAHIFPVKPSQGGVKRILQENGGHLFWHIVIDHRIRHNKDHLQEYEPVAQKLESANKDESARNIRAMTALIAQCNECLRGALKAL